MRRVSSIRTTTLSESPISEVRFAAMNAIGWCAFR